MEGINKIDQCRIAGDAYIAIDALQAIQLCGNTNRLHPEYLKEKLNTVKKCVEFMENFTE